MCDALIKPSSDLVTNSARYQPPTREAAPRPAAVHSSLDDCVGIVARCFARWLCASRVGEIWVMALWTTWSLGRSGRARAVRGTTGWKSGRTFCVDLWSYWASSRWAWWSSRSKRCASGRRSSSSSAAAIAESNYQSVWRVTQSARLHVLWYSNFKHQHLNVVFIAEMNTVAYI